MVLDTIKDKCAIVGPFMDQKIKDMEKERQKVSAKQKNPCKTNKKKGNTFLMNFFLLFCENFGNIVLNTDILNVIKHTDCR